MARGLAIAACLTLLGGAAAGCQTTQETAALRQMRAKRILKARELRHHRHRAGKHHRERSEKQ
jgi:hypothetical protein